MRVEWIYSRDLKIKKGIPVNMITHLAQGSGNIWVSWHFTEVFKLIVNLKWSHLCVLLQHLVVLRFPSLGAANLQPVRINGTSVQRGPETAPPPSNHYSHLDLLTKLDLISILTFKQQNQQFRVANAAFRTTYLSLFMPKTWLMKTSQPQLPLWLKTARQIAAVG